MRKMLLLYFICVLNFSHSARVLTISDSIVDYILHVDEAYVRSIPGKKGGSALVDEELFQKIIHDSKSDPIIRPGSSGVNTIKGLQQLGHHCAVVTTIGKDEDGDFFLRSLKAQGIRPILQTSLLPTGRSACLVSENGERTMRTFLGASKENDKLHLNPGMFQGISHLHIEGYQLKHQQLIRNALALAKRYRASVSLDLASFEVVQANKEFIWKLLHERAIDVLFSNQEEAQALSGYAPQKAAEHLAHHCKTAVVTMGENGCYVSQGTTQWRCPAMQVDVVDTIGAGDLFISGFLHGYLSGQSPSLSACWGTYLASQVVQVFGAEISHEQWKEIAHRIANDRSLSQEVSCQSR